MIRSLSLSDGVFLRAFKSSFKFLSLTTSADFSSLAISFTSVLIFIIQSLNWMKAPEGARLIYRSAKLPSSYFAAALIASVIESKESNHSLRINRWPLSMWQNVLCSSFIADRTENNRESTIPISLNISLQLLYCILIFPFNCFMFICYPLLNNRVRQYQFSTMNSTVLCNIKQNSWAFSWWPSVARGCQHRWHDQQKPTGPFWDFRDSLAGLACGPVPPFWGGSFLCCSIITSATHNYVEN